MTPVAKKPDLTLVWFRQDLRLSDHPALQEACKRGAALPVYIDDPEGEGAWAPGGASRWWLHHSLERLDVDLRAKGSRLILRRGDSLNELRALIAESGATAVFWSRRYEPWVEARDKRIAAALRSGARSGAATGYPDGSRPGIQARENPGVAVDVFCSGLLFEPESIRTRAAKGPYQVFTPFYRATLMAPEPPPPLPAPRKIPAPDHWPASLNLAALRLLPRIPWDAGLQSAWRPGSAGAKESLTGSLEDTLAGYSVSRDIPSVEGTSRISPHLHFGEIGIRETWAGLQERLAAAGRDAAAKTSLLAWQRQLIWREFAHHLLVHFPHTPEKPLRPAFDAFPWNRDPEGLKAWHTGRTGYPYVDAGMRQLWATGWMHNRVRMAAASFLVKHLLVPWQAGAKWFWDTLVDADLAQNTLGWQWVAGSGADAAPYFRIFHPVTQGERFDPRGDYIRRWVPELVGLDARWIHRPWEAPIAVLAKAGVAPGRNYPKPIVDHAFARTRALAAYHSLRDKAVMQGTAVNGPD
ncbi:MAG: deoxyribodipyrimidine photo-lyase [Fibrobacteria bacterium]